MGLPYSCRRTAAGLPWTCCTAAVELCSSFLSFSDDHGGGDVDQFQSCLSTVKKLGPSLWSLSSFIKFINVYKVYLGAKLTDLEKVYNSWGNNDDFKKLTAIILMPTKVNYQNVYCSLGNNNSFYKNDENSLRFKGGSWESLDENHEKGVTTTNNTPGNVSFLYKDFH